MPATTLRAIILALIVALAAVSCGDESESIGAGSEGTATIAVTPYPSVAPSPESASPTTVVAAFPIEKTAGGVTIAVLKKLAEQGAIQPEDLTVALVTGNGLKTQEAIDGHVAPSFYVKPTVESFEQTLADRGISITE